MNRYLGNPETEMSAQSRFSYAVTMVLALGLATLTGCGGETHHAPAGPSMEPLAVVTAPAVTADWDDGIEVTAGVLPLHRAMPGTVLMGRVDQVAAQEGDSVIEGQLLARIESRDVAARVAQAEAGVAAAQAMEHNAKLMKDRMERLHLRQAASRKNFDDAAAGHEAALANLAAAEEGVKAAEVYLGYSEIRAPFAGRVVQKNVEVGDTAAPGMPLFVIEDTSKVKIEAQVPESVAGGLTAGASVEVELQGETRQARLAELVPAADPRSRTFTVRALLDNTDGRFRSGMFARVRIPGEGRAAVTVPETAVVRRGPLTGVFTVDDGEIARLRWVTLGRETGGNREVLTGLAAGERVVAQATPGLVDGRPVEVR